MNLNFLNIVSLFSGFLLFLLGIIFLFYPHGKRASNVALSAFMFSNGILLLNFFANMTIHSYWLNYQITNHFGEQSYLLLSPFLYIYIASLCKTNFRFSSKHILHILPYAVFVSYAILVSFHNDLKSVNFYKNWQLFGLIFSIALHIQIATYLAYSFHELYNYRKQINEHYSNLVKINLTWVNIVLYIFIVMWLSDFFNFVLAQLKINIPWLSMYLFYQSVITDLVLCVSLIYKGMQQTSAPSAIVSAVKYGQSKLELNDYEKYKKILVDFIDREKPYLTTDLTLDELSKKTNIPQKHLSQTIHTCFNLNFNNFINLHRVEEAKRLMKLDTKDKKTLFQVLYDSGFNSKSVFNDSFKKNTGFTPKEYRKNIKS
jgi:AraC-like DNA-binding protein